jgi:hypothetical protein
MSYELNSLFFNLLNKSALYCYLHKCAKIPLLSFGSIQVDLGGIILLLSETNINSSIEVG